MTKGEARAQFLRYLGAATVNGEPRADGDLRDAFDYLLSPALVQVAAQFSPRATAAVSGAWDAPEDFFELTQAVGEDGAPVAYRQLGDRHFVFAAPCTAEYTVIPPILPPDAPEDAVLELDCRAALLVPVRAAIDAALATEEYAYKAPYLTATYNGLASALGERGAVSKRTVYAV